MTTPTESQVDRSVCDFEYRAVNEQPFPHLIHEHFIQPEIYEQLRGSFPNCPPNTGPTGYSLYWGDKGYQKLLDRQPAWKALFRCFHSQPFIDWAREQFSPWWTQLGCTIDLENARYVPYREDVSTKTVSRCAGSSMSRTNYGFGWTSIRAVSDTRASHTSITGDACSQC